MLAKLLFCFILILCSCSEVNEDLPTQVIIENDIKIELTPSTNSLRTCDLLELTIEITYPQNLKIKLPDSKADYGDFSIYQINQNSPVALNEKLNRLSQVIILEPGLPANHILPPLNFNFWNENNDQSNYKSETLDFKVVSILNDHKDIEDIITKTNKTENTVVLVGSSALVLTIIYLLFFSKADKTNTPKPIKEAFEKFIELKTLNENELLTSLPKASSVFLKEKYSLVDLPDNLDVIIRQLSEEQELQALVGNLQALLKSYNQIRYGAKEVNKEETHKLFNSFQQVFEGLQS